MNNNVNITFKWIRKILSLLFKQIEEGQQFALTACQEIAQVLDGYVVS